MTGQRYAETKENTMTLGPQLSRQMAEIVGAEYVLEDPTQCAAYAVQSVIPRFVVAPGTIDELAEILAAAFAAQATVVPWGGGSQQARGHRPQRVDLVVRTSRLNRVIEYEPADLTISVEAGITMAALRETLARNGQMLPVDTPLPHQATLGGVLATASDGPRRLGYGTLRDLLIGIRVVEATGRISKAGGMVVKNVSGFDMMKLYLGSMGTLALIASANFKLIPRPRAAATVWCHFATQSATFALVDALHTSQLNPTAVEYVSFNAPQIENPEAVAATHRPFVRSSLLGRQPMGLAALTEGLPAAVERQVRAISHLAEQAGALALYVLRDDHQEAFWTRIADLPQTAYLTPGEMLVQLTCLPAELQQALQEATDRAMRYGLALQIDARALSGVAYLRLRDDEQDSSGAALHQWQRDMLAHWPHLAVLACPEHLKPTMEIWGRTPVDLALMQRIKAEFDPQSQLNPGRFVV
jgi:glycolate oxidase FAD binding subunit